MNDDSTLGRMVWTRQQLKRIIPAEKASNTGDAVSSKVKDMLAMCEGMDDEEADFVLGMFSLGFMGGTLVGAKELMDTITKAGLKP